MTHPFFKYTWASMARSPVIRRRESRSVRRSSGTSSQRNQVAVTFGARVTVTSGVQVGLIRPLHSLSVNPSLDTPSPRRAARLSWCYCGGCCDCRRRDSGRGRVVQPRRGPGGAGAGGSPGALPRLHGAVPGGRGRGGRTRGRPDRELARGLGARGLRRSGRPRTPCRGGNAGARPALPDRPAGDDHDSDPSRRFAPGRARAMPHVLREPPGSHSSSGLRHGRQRPRPDGRRDRGRSGDRLIPGGDVVRRRCPSSGRSRATSGCWAHIKITHMARELRSRTITEGVQRSPNRAMLRAVGFGDRDFDKPIVGVANAYSTITPCNIGLDGLARRAEAALRAAGVMPQTFGTITVSDGISMGTEGMKYSLVSREVIADSIETACNAQCMDGLLVVGGCDKNMPGAMIAIARMNIPAIFVYGGTIKPGRHAGRDLTIVSVFEAVGEYSAGRPDAAQLPGVERRAWPGARPRGGELHPHTPVHS